MRLNCWSAMLASSNDILRLSCRRVFTLPWIFRLYYIPSDKLHRSAWHDRRFGRRYYSAPDPPASASWFPCFRSPHCLARFRYSSPSQSRASTQPGSPSYSPPSGRVSLGMSGDSVSNSRSNFLYLVLWNQIAIVRSFMIAKNSFRVR